MKSTARILILETDPPSKALSSAIIRSISLEIERARPRVEAESLNSLRDGFYELLTLSRQLVAESRGARMGGMVRSKKIPKKLDLSAVLWTLSKLDKLSKTFARGHLD